MSRMKKEVNKWTYTRPNIIFDMNNLEEPLLHNILAKLKIHWDKNCNLENRSVRISKKRRSNRRLRFESKLNKKKTSSKQVLSKDLLLKIKKMIMIGFFVMIAAEVYLKEKRYGNVNNVQTICFVKLVMN